MKIQFPNIGIVGTGAMGRGIAQISAQAGSQVFLLDANPGAAQAAQAALQEQWAKLVAKGRIEADEATALAARLHPVQAVADLAGCDLVVEAIVERLDVKKTLFAELEAVVRSDAVLATNTSSLSVTAIAAGLQRPERLAGFHFFNPVP
ncbi:MAG: 3-hydroxyacyl-CoA dehydrogenase, partial [Acidovorax sp.]